MMYVFYGSLAVLLWKCGSQLLKEVRYKNPNEEDELKKKAKLTKGTKYSKVFYWNTPVFGKFIYNFVYDRNEKLEIDPAFQII